MSIEELERILVQFLRTNLATLKDQVGQTSEWIYVDYPRLDAKMPRISLTLSASPERSAFVGSEIGESGTLGVYEESDFDIDIWVHRTNKTTGLTPKRGGTSLRDYIADQIVNLFLEKRGTLAKDYEIIDIEKINEIPHPYDEENELFRKTLTFRITHIRKFQE